MKTLACITIVLILLVSVNIYLAWRNFWQKNKKSALSDEEAIPPRDESCPRDLLAHTSRTVVMSHEEYQKLRHVSETDSSLLKVGDTVRLGPDAYGWHLIATLESRSADGMLIFRASQVCFGRSSEA